MTYEIPLLFASDMTSAGTPRYLLTCVADSVDCSSSVDLRSCLSATCLGIQKEREAACLFAQYLASLCHSISYIQIESWSWQMLTPRWLRPVDPVPSIDTYSFIELRQLEYEEVLTIDVFAMQKFVPQSSLMAHEVPHEMETDEERERTNRIMEEISLAVREEREPRQELLEWVHDNIDGLGHGSLQQVCSADARYSRRTTGV